MPTRGISEWARADPDRPAFLAGDVVRTYAEFDERTSRVAHALTDLGVGSDDRVAIMLPNSIEFFEAWAAANKAGASVVLVNWHLKADELEYILGDSGAAVLVAHAELAEHVETALAAVPECSLMLIDGGVGRGLDGAIAGVPDDAPAIELSALTAPVFYTSGTTGRPKGVVHGAPDPAAAARNMEGQLALWGWSADDVYILSGPAYHAGPGGWTMAASYVGAPTAVLESFDAGEWLRLVDRHHVTCSFMVPAHFIRILEVPAEERAARDHSSLRLIVHAGAPCPVPVKRRIIEALAPCEIAEL
jgi:long-chain acyl-CoA synthetase